MKITRMPIEECLNDPHKELITFYNDLLLVNVSHMSSKNPIDDSFTIGVPRTPSTFINKLRDITNTEGIRVFVRDKELTLKIHSQRERDYFEKYISVMLKKYNNVNVVIAYNDYSLDEIITYHQEQRIGL